MTLLALDRDFQAPFDIGRYRKPAGELTVDPWDTILRDCSLLLAPNTNLMRNLAPRTSLTASSAPIGDPVFLEAGGAIGVSRFGNGIKGHNTVNTTHSSWAAIEHPKSPGFTLFGAIATTSTGFTSGNAYPMYFSGSGGDTIMCGFSRYVGQHILTVNWSGATVNSAAGVPYLDLHKDGQIALVVGRTFANNSHEVDAYNPVEGVMHNATDTTNVPAKLDDTTNVTFGYSTAPAGSVIALYSGYWNRALTDQEVKRLLFNPMSLFRRQ